MEFHTMHSCTHCKSIIPAIRLTGVEAKMPQQRPVRLASEAAALLGPVKAELNIG